MIAIESAKNRYLSERDLRELSTAEFVELLRNDARELDTRLAEQRAKNDGLAAVFCCGKYLGRFLPASSVRCPRCATWHKPGAIK